MPDDRRKTVPRDLRSAAALRTSRENQARKSQRAKRALEKLLFRNLDTETKKVATALASAPIDLHVLYRAGLVDLVLLSDALRKQLIEPKDYSNKRLRYLDLLRRLGVSSVDVDRPEVTSLECIVPPIQSDANWYCDPETGEPLGRDALNPDEEGDA